MDIENNIKEIKKINDNFKKLNNFNTNKIKFVSEEEKEIKKFVENIGYFYSNENNFRFQKCPINNSYERI